MTGEYRLSGLGEGWEGPAIDEYFQKTLDQLGFSPERIAAYCRLRMRSLPRETQKENEPFQTTDDCITELVCGETTIATVLEIRNDFNFSQMLFADYLTPEVMERLHEHTHEP